MLDKGIRIACLAILLFVGWWFLYHKEQIDPCSQTPEARYFGCEETETLVEDYESAGGPLCRCTVRGVQREFWATPGGRDG